MRSILFCLHYKSSASTAFCVKPGISPIYPFPVRLSAPPAQNVNTTSVMNECVTAEPTVTTPFGPGTTSPCDCYHLWTTRHTAIFPTFTDQNLKRFRPECTYSRNEPI